MQPRVASVALDIIKILAHMYQLFMQLLVEFDFVTPKIAKLDHAGSTSTVGKLVNHFWLNTAIQYTLHNCACRTWQLLVFQEDEAHYENISTAETTDQM